jgi:hypothetical protein
MDVVRKCLLVCPCEDYINYHEKKETHFSLIKGKVYMP